MSSQAPKPGHRRPSPHSGQFAASRPISVRPSSFPAPSTYEGACRSGLQALCSALGRSQELAGYSSLTKFLFQDWGSTVLPEEAPYPSNIGDDHSPFEYSLAFDPGGVELRLLFEAQARSPSRAGNLQAAIETNHRLQAHHGIDLSRFSRIQDLFLDGPPALGFSMWHAVCLNPGREPAFKLYLNPKVHGQAQALPLMEEAMTRLGFGDEAVRSLRSALPRAALDELSYFSLDLSNKPNARVKVYIAHPAIAAEELDQVFTLCPAHRPGDVVEFCQAMVKPTGPFTSKPLMSCLSFVQGSEKPTTMTLHLPIAHYVESDQVTAERVTSFLRRQGLNHEAYTRSLAAVARRPLAQASGVQSYASYRREKGGLRFTAYLSPELFRKT